MRLGLQKKGLQSYWNTPHHASLTIQENGENVEKTEFGASLIHSVRWER